MLPLDSMGGRTGRGSVATAGGCPRSAGKFNAQLMRRQLLTLRREPDLALSPPNLSSLCTPQVRQVHPDHPASAESEEKKATQATRENR